MPDPSERPYTPQLQQNAGESWIPSQLARVAIASGVACVSAVGQYMATVDPAHPFSWKSAASSCIMAAGGYLATYFGIGSSGVKR
jgi:hypothetical protein